jgi:NAD-dependent deacetylase
MSPSPHVAPAARFTPLPIRPTTRVFVLTGAGISAESGIQTFRDAGGLWEQHRVEDVASPLGWRRDPGLVWRFYAQRRVQACRCEPNVAHRALARLGELLGGSLFLCTQNVDDLHERAGSRNVVHMHGELFRSRCEDPRCSSLPFEDRLAYTNVTEIPRCGCGARIRPHIVWFGEVPFALDAIGQALHTCEIFVTVGSSGAVYPAAGFVQYVRSRAQPAKSVYVGPEPPENADQFDECRLGPATEVLPSLFSVAAPSR